jgi:hypothetical protein
MCPSWRPRHQPISSIGSTHTKLVKCASIKLSCEHCKATVNAKCEYQPNPTSTAKITPNYAINP